MVGDSVVHFRFPAIFRKKVTAAFDGGRLTSDGGVLLLAQAERGKGIAGHLANCIAAPLDPTAIMAAPGSWRGVRSTGSIMGSAFPATGCCTPILSLSVPLMLFASIAPQEGSAVLCRYAEARYAAKNWGTTGRRIVARIEASTMGLDIGFVVTSLKDGTAERIRRSINLTGGVKINTI